MHQKHFIHPSSRIKTLSMSLKQRYFSFPETGPADDFFVFTMHFVVKPEYQYRAKHFQLQPDRCKFPGLCSCHWWPCIHSPTRPPCIRISKWKRCSMDGYVAACKTQTHIYSCTRWCSCADNAFVSCWRFSWSLHLVCHRVLMYAWNSKYNRVVASDGPMGLLSLVD